jgi:two-component system, chemotaxis family, response regulator Rcp1
MTTDGKVAEILLVEDNPADVRLTKEALRGAKVPIRLNVVADGMEALDYLRRQGRHATAARPDLIFLDLNLPKKDGRQVLAEIKADEKLKRIPIVVLTTSRSHEDVFEAYGLHANCYLCKSADFAQFLYKIVSALEVWLTIATLPPRSAGDSGSATDAQG